LISGGLIRRCTWLALVAFAASCTPAPTPQPHYLLGRPYQSGGTWWYPRESQDADLTGLAGVYGPGHADLTADGELFDQSALAVASHTLQLPAIALLTDLDTGRQVKVRINDRGPATPHRLIEVTRRTAELLGFPASGVARVRLQVLAGESQAAVDAVGGGPQLDMSVAPRGAVETADLPPPPGVRQSAAAGGSAAQPVAAPGAGPAASAVPLRLPETLTQVNPNPGSLYVDVISFDEFRYANQVRARLAGLPVQIETSEAGRRRIYRVVVGPFASIPEADAALDQVLARGVTEARIVVE
jgi:rare lipoprotein A